jgi:transposase
VKNMNRKEMLAIYHQGPEAVITAWTALIFEIKELRSRVEQLENQGKKNSKNSHKPPSSDEFNKPKPKSLRLKTGRKSGGQKGHPGYTLRAVEKPDCITVHRVTECTSCGCSLAHIPASRHEKRQVFDFPPLCIEVTQHEAEVKTCPSCRVRQKAAFPNEVKNPVQYGPNIQALIVYLTQYQLLPYKRTAQLLHDVWGQPISEGTLVTMNRNFAETATFFEGEIHEALLGSRVVHFDETGIRVKGKRHWLHSASTAGTTAYFIHPTRGKKAMDAANLLPHFRGVAVHDAWSPYFTYDMCQHALCNVHHLRELQGIWELYKQAWAKDMMDFLLFVKQEKEQYHGILSSDKREKMEKSYMHILQRGFAENRLVSPLPSPKVRGRKKQSPAKNLLDRLYNYREYVLAFLRDPTIPFDNNQSERDVRMAKLKQKISGTFRGDLDPHAFCVIRSFISTIKKQGRNILSSIEQVIRGQSFSLFPH